MESKPPVICVPICERTIDALEQAIIQTQPIADIIEIRLDCLDPFQSGKSFAKLAHLFRNSSKPEILTYRPSQQGGQRELDLEARLSFWANCPDIKGFLDIEFDLVRSTIFDSEGNPDWSRVICSYHDFAGVPADLDQLYTNMAKTPARILKIAVQADDAVDCLGMFRLLERASREGREIIPIAMGAAGIATRILGPSRGAFLTYAAVDEKTATAPGQITARELRETYRIEKLNRRSEIFGLIGLPVFHSISPQIHNAAFAATGMNAVYISFEVTNPETFLRRMVHPMTREIDWNMRGLSVTAPHKFAVMNHLDWIEPAAKEIGAVNTILVKDNGLSGYNTDALGFIQPLAEKFGELRTARCAVIGAGGAASAAVWALLREGAEVRIFARRPEAAEALAKRFHVASGALKDASFEGFDVVVNATTVGTVGPFELETPVTAAQLGGARLAYDLVYNPRETQFLREAREAGCEPLGGLSMFIAQAAEQFRLWTGASAPESVMYEAANRELSSNSSEYKL
jgi:3-dehydroquinate dehydratase/shikimate dehydrogenase